MNGDVDGAINDLAAGLRVRPSDANEWNDYAVALYEKALREDAPEILAEALTAIDRAIDLAPTQPEALFNDGLILEALGLRSASDLVFQHYIALDGTSAWAVEVRNHLSARPMTAAAEWSRASVALEHAVADGMESEVLGIVSRFPQEARTWGEGEYLARWADAFSRHDELAAQQWLNVSRKIGDALATLTGETLLRDAAAAASVRDDQALTHLARAHLVFRQARIAYGRREVSKAAPQFDDAMREFGAAGSPMSKVAAYYVANVAYDHSNAEACLSQLDSIESATPSNYPALKAEILWTRGSSLARLNRLYESLDASLASLALFEKLGERDNATSVRSSASATLSHLGHEAQAWKLRQQVFRDASASGRTYLIELSIDSAARAALRKARPDIARALLGAQEELPFDSPRVRFDCVLWRAFAVAREERRPLTSQQRSAIARAAFAIRDADLRRDALDEARLGDAITLRAYNAAAALQLLDATISERLTRRRALELPRILLERARTLRALGRRGEAVVALYKTIDLVEGQQKTIAAPDLRDSYLGSSDAAFVELADILLEENRVPEAFYILDRARGRAIAERLSVAGKAAAVRIEEVARRLPPGTAMLEWCVLGDRTWSIVVNHRAWTSASIALSQVHLHEQVSALRAAIASGDDATANRASQDLYSRLLKPLLIGAPDVRTFVLVPDPAMESIPFAALRNHETGRFLIEEEEVVIAPSAAVYLSACGRAAVAPTRPKRAVLAGDPAITSSQFASLSRLPGAAEEVRLIARLYPQSASRIDHDASRAWFVAECVTGDVVHVASHAVMNEHEPWLSVLPLAADSQSDGLLYARDVASMRLQKSPVVVLAGCRTAAASEDHASIHNLALAFLAGGARTVAGTLWAVDDDVTRAFSIALHRELSIGGKPGQALRDAQLAMLNSSNPELRRIRTWGAFQLYGSEL